ncbi:MAG: T9SS C-terminal target domain-containing protein [Bacteroidia bacterium]|nr:MAG: T9SS C-terminal target domain-containing protein [Bacteroidia bacterium]
MRYKKTFFPVMVFIVLSFPAWGQITEEHQLSYIRLLDGLDEPIFEKGYTEFVMVDLNNNGHVDIASIGDHGNPLVNSTQEGLMIWFNDGNGNFNLHMEGHFGYGGIAAGDVNNNGFMDLAFGMHHPASSNLGSQLIEVALNDGTGMQWTQYNEGLAEDGQVYGMFGTDLGDVNNNGLLDLVSVSFGCCDGLHVYLNQGDGSWEPTFNIHDGDSYLMVKFADLNNNGFLDFVTNHSSGTAYFGDGNGNFVNNDNGLPSTHGYYRISVGDVNNDGSHGLAFTRDGGGVAVYEFCADDNIWKDYSGNLPTSGPWYFNQLYDMNANGYTDLVTFADGEVKVWLGDGQGNWTADATYHTEAGPGLPMGFKVGGDLTQNGFADMVFLYFEGPQWWNRINKLYVVAENSEPEELWIKNLYPKGNETFYPGSTRDILWASAVPDNAGSHVKIEISPASPEGPWTVVADSLPNNGRYQWNVHDFDSENCYLRLTVFSESENYSRIMENPFRILGETQHFQINAEPHNPAYGSVLGGGEYVNFDHVSLEAIPNQGYRFMAWKENDSILGTEEILEFYATHDRYIKGYFEADEYLIIASAAEHGTIIPEGEVYVAGEADQSFTITPDEDYSIQSILIDGEEIDMDNHENWDFGTGVFTFKNVGSDHSIEVFFQQDATGISELDLAEFIIYPNPASGHLWLEFHNKEGEKAKIKVFNTLGQVVKQKRVAETGDLKISLDTSALLPGLYFVTIKGSKLFSTRNFLVQP